MLDHTSGSHQIFRHAGTGTKLSFQPDNNGKAKAYQIKQTIRAVDKMKRQNVQPDAYTGRVFWSDEDSARLAVAEELEGCSARGMTRGEALREIETAISGWLESARKHGDPVPPPRSYKEAV